MIVLSRAALEEIPSADPEAVRQILEEGRLGRRRLCSCPEGFDDSVRPLPEWRFSGISRDVGGIVGKSHVSGFIHPAGRRLVRL